MPSLKDTSRIDCLNQLSDAYILTTEKDSAVYYAGLAFKESEKLNYIHGIAISFNNKSRIAKHFDDDFIQSETLGKESLHWFEKTSNKAGIDNLYSNLEFTVFSQSKFDEAIYYTKEEYLIAQKNSDTSKMWDALQTMFSIYRESGDYEKSLAYIEEAQSLASASKNKIRISDGLYGMAQLYELIEDYPDALNYFRQVVKMDDKDIEAQRVNNDYDIWFKMEFTEAFSHLHQFDGIGRKKAAELKSKSALTHKSMGMRITEDRIEMLQHQKQKGTFISINDLILPDGNPCGTEVLIKIPVCYD